jgi:hypothetical protein
VSRAFPSWNRSILTAIYLCNSCSYHEIEDGNARTGRAPRPCGRARGSLRPPHLRRMSAASTAASPSPRSPTATRARSSRARGGPHAGWAVSILTEIYLCKSCSYHEIEDGNARTGCSRVVRMRPGAPPRRSAARTSLTPPTRPRPTHHHPAPVSRPSPLSVLLCRSCFSWDFAARDAWLVPKSSFYFRGISWVVGGGRPLHLALVTAGRGPSRPAWERVRRAPALQDGGGSIHQPRAGAPRNAGRARPPERYGEPAGRFHLGSGPF